MTCARLGFAVIGVILERMHSEGRSLVRSTMMGGFVALLAAAAAGCASDRQEQQSAEAYPPDIWEMTIMSGRYGVMLSQARAILGVPEPADRAYGQFPSERSGETQERKALARHQVDVAKEFYADVASVCADTEALQSIRSLACSHQGGVPAHLRMEPKRDLRALSARNDALGEVIMPWWDAVCALAPKPGEEEGEGPVCVME